MVGHENLASALRRTGLAQFDVAIDGLTSRTPLRAVHDARKAMKRLRSMLRLVRSEIGTDTYRAENDTLRDTSRVLAPARDAEVAVETVQSLRERFGAQLAPTALVSIEGALVERRDRTIERIVDDGLIDTTVRSLRSAAARYRAWPADRVVQHDYVSVAPGIHRTYGRGRREMRLAIAQPTAHNFHQWRKRVKYLRHQYEFLEPLWPEMMTAHAESLDQLGELLGEEHDLSDIQRLMAEQPWICPDPVERALLAALSQHRRTELRRAAVGLGRRVYAERAPTVVGRLGSWWSAWEAERTAPTDY